MPTLKNFRIFTVFSLLVMCAFFGLEATTTSQSDPRSYPPKNFTAKDAKRSEAQQAMADAERLRAEWKEESLRRAIQQYDKAAHLWNSNLDFAAAGNATLKAGDVYFVFGEYKEAIKRYQNAGTLAVKAGDMVVEAKALSQLGRVQTYLGNNAVANKHATKALDLFKGRETNLDPLASNAYGEALSSLAEVTYERGDFVTSSELLGKALKFLDNDRDGQARVHRLMSYIAGGTGDPEKAATHISKALDLYRATGNKRGEGLMLTTRGLSQTGKKDPHDVISLQNEALALFRQIGDRHSQAITLNAIGQVYEFMNEPDLARNQYEQALQLFESISSLDGVSVSTFKLAQAHRRLGREDQALVYLERCLKVSRVAGKRRTEANALNQIGTIYIAQGRNELALRQFESLDRFYESIGDRRGQATALDTYGNLLFRFGEKQRAFDAYRRALLLSREVDDKVALLTALHSFAYVNLELGFPDVALSTIQESLRMIEDLRANVASPDLRTSYFAGLQKHYNLAVRILMELHQLRPADGFAVQAFLVNESGRARALNDLIGESQADLRAGVPEETIKRERELRASLRKMAQYEWDLSLNNGDPGERAEVSARRAKLLAEYQEIQALLRQRSPVERPALAELAQVQKELHDSDTLLLQYALGDERSYLWAVTSNSFQSHELPAGKEIEDAARQFYAALTARQSPSDPEYQARVQLADKAVAEVGGRLSQMLLSPVAGELKSRKLLFVTEGALQFISFDALHVPGAMQTKENRPQYLIETNDISVLPSVSTLIAIRAMPDRTSSPDKTIAVLADPVFNNDDDRVQRVESTAIASAASEPALDPAVQQRIDRVLRDNGASRLVYSSAEADAILAAAPSGTTMVAKGFEATREIAMSADVGQYQIVHFATHGFLNSEHPELSAIVLTMIDPNGVKTNGLMPLHDIYSLDLSAQLTVLSACQTALGKDIKGEGPVGLTHSFISAGSKSVVATVWKVDDRATSTLMRDFYHSLLQEGMPTSQALRAAKLKMLNEPQTSQPYYWAGFVLQGEYTNRIVVDNRWRPSRLVIVCSVVVIAVGLIVVFQLRRRRFKKESQS